MPALLFLENLNSEERKILMAYRQAPPDAQPAVLAAARAVYLSERGSIDRQTVTLDPLPRRLVLIS